MEYPHGHVGHHRHQNHRNNDEDDNSNYPAPPPPFSHSPFPPPPQPFGDSFNQPPPPPHHQSYNQPPPPHQSYGDSYNQPPHHSYGSAHDQPPPQPPHQSYGSAYDQPPPQPPHQSYGNAYDQTPPPSSGHHGFQPHMPSFVGSHSHHGPDDHGSSGHTYGGGPGPEMGLGQLENKPGHSIHCKAGGERFVFAIRDDKVILTHPDSSDLSQQWIKDEKYSTKVKDKEGHPSFVLVNKGTGQAVKHSVSCHPVQLTPYKPDVLDEAVLWTESKDLGSGYRTIRTVNNVHLVMDAWNADKDHGGIHNGTVIALYETWKGDNQNQQWKFVRH